MNKTYIKEYHIYNSYLYAISDCLKKPAMFTYKLKFNLLPQLIATLNNYACLLPPLANFNWYASPECFIMTMQIHGWWNGTNGRLQFSSGNLILLPLSLSLVVEYLPFVGACGCHSHSKPYQYVILLLCFNLCHHPLHPCVPPAHHVI